MLDVSYLDRLQKRGGAATKTLTVNQLKGSTEPRQFREQGDNSIRAHHFKHFNLVNTEM